MQTTIADFTGDGHEETDKYLQAWELILLLHVVSTSIRNMKSPKKKKLSAGGDTAFDHMKFYKPWHCPDTNSYIPFSFDFSLQLQYHDSSEGSSKGTPESA